VLADGRDTTANGTPRHVPFGLDTAGLAGTIEQRGGRHHH
jgi:hypothetical protein